MNKMSGTKMYEMSWEVMHGSIGSLKIAELLQSGNSEYLEYLMRLLQLEEDVCSQINEYFMKMFDKEDDIDFQMSDASTDLPRAESRPGYILVHSNVVQDKEYLLHGGKSRPGYNFQYEMLLLDEEYLVSEFEQEEYERVLEGLLNFIVVFNSIGDTKMPYESMIAGLDGLPAEVQYREVVCRINRWRADIHFDNLIKYVGFHERVLFEWSNPFEDHHVKRYISYEYDGVRFKLNNKYLVKKLSEPKMDLKTILRYHQEIIGLANVINGSTSKKIILSKDELSVGVYR